MTTTEHPITRSELREEFRELRREFREHYATKEDLAQLEVKLESKLGQLESKLIKWMVGVQVGGIAALATVVTAIIAIMRLLGD